MGRYIEQNEGRSELQQRIAAELRAKAAARSRDDDTETGYTSLDGGYDTEYLKGTKVTTTLAPAWVIITLAAVGIVVAFIVITQR